jgi:hypothetical protein
MSPEKCIASCKDAKKYAAAMRGPYCVCFQNVEQASQRLAEEAHFSKCSTPCPNAKDMFCGGPDTMSLFASFIEYPSQKPFIGAADPESYCPRSNYRMQGYKRVGVACNENPITKAAHPFFFPAPEHPRGARNILSARGSLHNLCNNACDYEQAKCQKAMKDKGQDTGMCDRDLETCKALVKAEDFSFTSKVCL